MHTGTHIGYTWYAQREDPHSAPVFSAGGLVRARGAWEQLASNQEPPTLSFSSPATSVHLVMSLD